MSFLTNLFERKPNIKKLVAKTDIEGLIKALDYPHDRDIVVSAIEALGQSGESTRAKEALLKVLINRYDDRWICEEVYSALLGFIPYSEVELLRTLRDLQDASETYRKEASYKLGELADVRAFQHLVAALKDRDGDVRRYAAASLGKLGTQSLDTLKTALKSADPGIVMGAAKGLAYLCIPQCVEPLIAALSHDDWSVRCDVAKALGKLCDRRAVEPLIDAMGFEKPREEVLRTALKDLPMDTYRTSEAKLGAVFLYGNLALGENEYVQKNAAKALGEIGDLRAVEPLIAALNSGKQNLQVAAAEALGKLADSKSVDLLLELLLKKGIKEEVRIAVANALGQIGDVSAIEHLTNLHRNVSELHGYKADIDTLTDVRKATAEALGKFGMLSFDSLSTALREGHKFAAYGLAEIKDTRAVESLLAALAALNYSQKCGLDDNLSFILLRALGRTGDLRAVEPLIEALNNQKSSWDVRSTAAEALGQMREQRGVSPLVAVLNTSEEGVKWAAIKALGQIGDGNAVGPLISVLQKDKNLRYMAADALAEIGPPSIAPLITALNDNDDDVKTAAAIALGKIGNAQAAAPLREVLRKNSSHQLRWSISEALEKLAAKQPTLNSSV